MKASYVVKRDALHGFVLLERVHFIQVAVSDEHNSVLRLVEVVDLENTASRLSFESGWWQKQIRCGGAETVAVYLGSHLAYVARKQDPHEFVSALQLAGDQREGRRAVGAVSLLEKRDTRKTRHFSVSSPQVNRFAVAR